MKNVKVWFFSAVATFIFAMSASAQAPYWEASGNNIKNINSGRVKVLGVLEIAEAGESAYIRSHEESTDFQIRSYNGVFRLFYDEQFEIWSTSPTGALFRLKSTGDAWFFGTHPGDSSHRLGIGTMNPSSKLTVAGKVQSTQGGFMFPDGTVQVTAATGSSNFLEALDGDPEYAVWVDASGRVGIGTQTPAAQLDVIGTTRTTVLEITGADLAEPFAIASQMEIRPGLVASIDPANPGGLRISNSPYDRTVVGVISGAGGINPGIVMAKDEIKDGNYPIALTGRVYVYADSSNGSIIPGDLLTTSEIPGHVMRVTDYGRANGSILGKAMTGLENDNGLVLMVVALQ